MGAVVLRGGGGDLDGRHREQGRTEHCQDCLSHRKSPLVRRLVRDKRRLAVAAPSSFQIEMCHANFYATPITKHASKFVGQERFAAKYSADERVQRLSTSLG
jgi:hypothetical protein